MRKEIRLKEMLILKKKIIIGCIAVISVISASVFAYTQLSSNEEVEVASITNNVENFDILDESVFNKLNTVNELNIINNITNTTNTTNIVEENAVKKEVVKYKNKEITIPKSTVAAANSSEDAERNKKTGGEKVSQEQTETMFQNVGTKSFGIDVSAHQGKINWATVKASGVDFAMIRCGFRGQTAGAIYEDKYFKSNVSSATANGIKVGIYFYSTAANEQEALEEAAWVVKKIAPYRITYPVVYDFEDFGAYRCSEVDGNQATKNAKAFLDYIESSGYEPMLYASKNDISKRFSKSSFSCKFWLAHYTSQTDYKGSYQMWQYTSKGSVPGISGNVDMNIAYFSYGTVAEPKHTHNYTELVKNSENAATCTQDGVKTLRCSCGETQEEKMLALGHTFGEWKKEKEATEKEEGLEKRICSICSEEETRKIDKIKPNKNTNTVNNIVDNIVDNTINNTVNNITNNTMNNSITNTSNTIKNETTNNTISNEIIDKNNKTDEEDDEKDNSNKNENIVENKVVENEIKENTQIKDENVTNIVTVVDNTLKNEV